MITRIYLMRPKLVLILLLAPICANLAADPKSYSIYRSTNGGGSPDALADADALMEAATELGAVNVWVTFDVPIETNPAKRTSKTSSVEKKLTKIAFKEHIRPLVKDGLVLDHSLLFANGAPGCMILITSEGLASLLANSHIVQISTML